MSIVVTAPRFGRRPSAPGPTASANVQPARHIPSLSALRLRADRFPSGGRRGPFRLARTSCSSSESVSAQISVPHAARARPAAPRLRLTRRGRFVLLGLPLLTAFAALAVLALIVLTPGTAGAAVGHEAAPTHQVTVAPGDTLWDVAAEADPRADTRDVMEEIVDLNGLEDSTLAPGQVLAVPSVAP